VGDVGGGYAAPVRRMLSSLLALQCGQNRRVGGPEMAERGEGGQDGDRLLTRLVSFGRVT
jgi:hypothetical protein